MNDNIELQDRSKHFNDNKAPSAQNAQLESIALWSWASAFIILLSASCLYFFPRLLLFFSSTNQPRTELSPLEYFLAQHFGIWLAAIAFAVIFNIPSPRLSDLQPKSNEPYQPLLSPLTIAATLSAFFSWNTTSVGSLGSVVFVSSLTISLWGFWVILFAGSSFISKTTGADKHTSRFIFGNKSAASEIKKRWKKEHKQ